MIKHFLIILFLVFIMTSCENSIEGPEDINPDNGVTDLQATFSSIQKNVLTPTCALPACHGGSQSPNLSAGQAYDNLVNKASAQNPSLLRVAPGESTNSYLIKKLNGDGTSMMPPTGKLSQDVINLIAEWINDGALNN